MKGTSGMSRANECKGVLARVGDLAALTAHHAQLEEPHLVVCGECRENVARTRVVLDGLDAIPVRAPQGDLSDRVMMRIQSAPAPAWAARAAARSGVTPKIEVRPAEPVRRPIVAAEPETGFFDWLGSLLTGRALAPAAMGLAVVLFALVAIKPATREQVARTVAPASPIVEEPDVVERGAPGVQVASTQGGVTVFAEGAWKPITAGASFAAGQRAAVAPGGRASLTLPDGSKLDVGGDTEVVAFAERVRVRRGHVRFDVMHRPERIFRVLIPDGEVRVLGTLFDVDAATAGSRVHLLHGRLEVQCAAQVERLEDGDGVTIAGGKLTKLAAAERSGASDVPSSASSSNGPAATETTGDVAAPPDAPVVPPADPRPAVQATAASGPAPLGLK